MLDNFKAWRNTRKIPLGSHLNEQQMSELMQAVKFSVKAKSILKGIWFVISGACTVIAAVFSILAYFK